MGAQMWSPGSRPSVELLPDLLQKMPMLFFAGVVGFLRLFTCLRISSAECKLHTRTT